MSPLRSTSVRMLWCTGFFRNGSCHDGMARQRLSNGLSPSLFSGTSFPATSLQRRLIQINLVLIHVLQAIPSGALSGRFRRMRGAMLQ